MWGVNSTATIQGDSRRWPHHLEQREHVLARPGFIKPTGGEAGSGDQGAGEHGEGGGGVGIGGGAKAVPALLQLEGHHLDGDDGIVHQQAQGDDQRAGEMRCSSMLRKYMARKVSASTRGMHRATTRPVRRPREKEADQEHDDHRFQRRFLNSWTDSSTTRGWSETAISTPTGRLA